MFKRKMRNKSKAKIIEIFKSIQGEGSFIGYKQLFIRFAGCNLRCKYCDTNYLAGSETKNYTVEEILKFINNSMECHSVSLTGGEPLLHTDFLLELLPQCKLDIYLETNATLYNELSRIIDYITYISADIKLPSCSGCENLWDKHDKFFEYAKEKTLFAKVVFDDKVTDLEIQNCIKLAQKYNFELILQPKMYANDFCVTQEKIENVFNQVSLLYPKTRLIPQVQKFLNVR